MPTRADQRYYEEMAAAFVRGRLGTGAVARDAAPEAAIQVGEHVPDPERAAAEAVRVARRFVVASAPSHPDNNPDHVRLFTAEALDRLFLAAGAARVAVEFVPNHMIAVVRVNRLSRA